MKIHGVSRTGWSDFSCCGDEMAALIDTGMNIPDASCYL